MFRFSPLFYAVVLMNAVPCPDPQPGVISVIQAASVLDDKRGLRKKLMDDTTALLAPATYTTEQRSLIESNTAQVGQLTKDIAFLEEAERGSAEERGRQQAADDAARRGRPPLAEPGATLDVDQTEEQRQAEKVKTDQRNEQHLRAHTHYLRTKDESQLRAMNSTNGANGGFTIPTIVTPVLTQAMLAFGGVIPFLDSLVTSSGEQINYPINNDTANIGRELGENVAATETDLTIGTVPLTTGLFSTDMVQIPRTLLRDSVVDLQTIVTTALAIRRARLLATKVINGSNTGSFASLLNGATVGATSQTPGAIDLVDLALTYGAVDPGYAVNGKFAMHRSVQIYLATQRNGLGAPIFTLDANGMLTKIFGCDVVVDQTMPALVGGVPVAGQKYVIFGDLKSYIFRTVGTMEVMRLEERYAEFNQVAFMGWYSAGGQLLDAGTHPIQALVQHA